MYWKKTEFQLYVYLKKNNVWLSCLLYLLKCSCVHVYSMSNTICVKWEGWISSCVICIENLANKLYWYVVKTSLINPFNPRLSKKKGYIFKNNLLLVYTAKVLLTKYLLSVRIIIVYQWLLTNVYHNQ